MAENPKIKIVSGEHQGQTFELTGEEHLIGRKEHCDICIPDTSVSSRHCLLIRQENGDYKIEDCNSTNGTIINGNKVMKQTLHDEDAVRVGRVECVYESAIKHNKAKMPHPPKKGAKKVNLRETAGSSNVTEASNFSPFGSSDSGIDKGLGKVTRILGISLIATLTIIVLVALVFVILNLR